MIPPIERESEVRENEGYYEGERQKEVRLDKRVIDAESDLHS